MSKMSWLHAELSERASELGFESLEDAERNGYEMHMDGMTPTLKPNASKQLELAHKAWLKEKKEILDKLDGLYNKLCYLDVEGEFLIIINDTIEFIKKGEM